MTETLFLSSTRDNSRAEAGAGMIGVEQIGAEHDRLGDVIQGTGGVQKVRCGLQRRGKRGGARVI